MGLGHGVQDGVGVPGAFSHPPSGPGKPWAPRGSLVSPFGARESVGSTSPPPFGAWEAWGAVWRLSSRARGPGFSRCRGGYKSMGSARVGNQKQSLFSGGPGPHPPSLLLETFGQGAQKAQARQ